MPQVDDDLGLAPKVFFVDPDPAMVSETFLEAAFFQGFEAYSLADNLGGDLTEKVRVLSDSFPKLLLFFTIDRKGSLKAWLDYLREIQGVHGDQIRIGVLYEENKTLNPEPLVKKAFNFDVGISAGCIPLGVSPKKNHAILLRVLEANQAMGRRKFIRMRCHPSCRATFLRNNRVVEGVLLDLSISHFSVKFDSEAPEWLAGTKLTKVQLRIQGMFLLVNALVVTRRLVRDIPCFLFLIHHEDEPGSTQSLKAKINLIIFQAYQTKTQAFLEEKLKVTNDEEPVL